MRKLIIILLIVIIIGLWFIPDITKKVIKKTGQVGVNVTKTAIKEIKIFKSV